MTTTTKIREALAKIGLQSGVQAIELDRAALAIAKMAAIQMAGAAGATAIRVGTEASVEELEALNDSILKLAEQFHGLSPLAKIELEKTYVRDNDNERGILEALSELSAAVVTSQWVLSDPEHAIPRLRTKPRKTAPTAIAVYLSAVFKQLTGREPGRDVRDGKDVSNFTVLVAETFEALGLKASAENSAKQALEKRQTK